MAEPYTRDTQGQYRNSINTCAMCDAMCSFCNGPLDTDCFSCVGTNKLIDEQALCVSKFSHALGGPDYPTCSVRRCIPDASCPTYYFFVSTNDVENNAYYAAWSNAVTQTNLKDNPAVTYRRFNSLGVCYLCD